MTHLVIKLDVDERGFDALSGLGTAAEGVASGKVIHLGEGTKPIEIGTLRAGMQSGKDSVAICFPLPDGKVVVAETSAELFMAAGRAIAAWQEGRHERGEG